MRSREGRRLLCALALLVAALALPPVGALAIALVAWLAMARANVAGRALRRLAIPLLTTTIAVALAAYQQGGQAAWALLARVLGATSVSAWLVATSSGTALVASLAALGLPRPLVELVLLSARYVEVIGESVTTAREAQRLRLGWQRLRTRLSALGVLAGFAMARAVDQSLATGEAMRLRGGLK